MPNGANTLTEPITDMSPSSSAAVSVTSPEDSFRPSEVMITIDYSNSSTSSSSPMTQSFPFSSGNPRIEETRGVMHLFSSDGISGLPVCSIILSFRLSKADYCFIFYY